LQEASVLLQAPGARDATGASGARQRSAAGGQMLQGPVMQSLSCVQPLPEEELAELALEEEELAELALEEEELALDELLELALDELLEVALVELLAVVGLVAPPPLGLVLPLPPMGGTSPRIQAAQGEMSATGQSRLDRFI
jgi:hypothetical protein